jgi:hypothetical protein
MVAGREGTDRRSGVGAWRGASEVARAATCSSSVVGAAG